MLTIAATPLLRPLPCTAPEGGGMVWGQPAARLHACVPCRRTVTAQTAASEHGTRGSGVRAVRTIRLSGSPPGNSLAKRTVKGEGGLLSTE